MIRQRTKSKRDRFTTVAAQNWIIIEAYAPVEWKEEQEREEFYEDLNLIIEECKQAYPQNTTIVMGDMNAHISGYYGDETNENGRLLLKTWKEQALAIAPFQGPTFERGECRTAVDYILLDREAYRTITETNIWSRQWVQSDHNIIEIKIARQELIPTRTNAPPNRPPQRLKIPLARKVFKENLTKKWQLVKDADFHTAEDRYACYVTLI